MKSGNFFAELKRRNVYKVAVAYAVVGWKILASKNSRANRQSEMAIYPLSCFSRVGWTRLGRKGDR
jgi:hypothetical protein